MAEYPEEWPFSPPLVNTTYFSSTVESADLLGANKFADLILNSVFLHQNVLPAPIAQTLDIVVQSGDLGPLIESVQNNWPDMLKENTTLFAMVVFGLAVAILLPISGVIAACVAKCRTKANIVQKRDTFYIGLQAVTYFLLVTLGWIGVAWLNKSGLALQKEIKQLPDTVNGYVKCIIKRRNYEIIASYSKYNCAGSKYSPHVILFSAFLMMQTSTSIPWLWKWSILKTRT